MSSYDHTQLNDLIHSRLRLGIMAYLSGTSPAIFGELRDKVKASDGNLSIHLSKLEEAGYVTLEKRFVGKRPQTRIFITDSGKTAWIDYLEQLGGLLNAAE